MARTGDLLVDLEARIGLTTRVRGRFTPVGVLDDRVLLAFEAEGLDVELDPHEISTDVDVATGDPSAGDHVDAEARRPTDSPREESPGGSAPSCSEGAASVPATPSVNTDAAPAPPDGDSVWRAGQRTRVLDLLETLARKPGHVHSLITGCKRRLKVEHLHDLDTGGLEIVLRDVEALLRARGGNP
jgi:hypothetical protein